MLRETAMVETHAHFDKRLAKLSHKHRLMSRGYVNVLTSDGLIVSKPRRFRRNNSGLRMIAIVLVGFFLLKAISFANIGEEGYNDRLAVMRTGTTIEQVGAVIMGPDAITKSVAQIIGPFLR